LLRGLPGLLSGFLGCEYARACVAASRHALSQALSQQVGTLG